MNTIFVSSTFIDMQFERDILQKQVLPRLQEFAKSYGETVELCDLRWGINTAGMDEQQSTSKILQICFDEIDRSRPLFIGLLGDRYGWIPEDALVRDILENQSRNIPESEHKSVTELEMLYSMMKDRTAGVFYFRTITNAKSGLFRKSVVPKAYSADRGMDERMIRNLKRRIRTHCPKQVRDYFLTWIPEKQSFNGLSEFAEMLYEDLRKLLEARFSNLANISEADRQERQVRYFLENDHCFQSADQMSVRISPEERDRLLEGSWADDTQNVYFYGSEPYLLDRLMASLFFVYQDLDWRVIPYDCGMSMFTGTTENLLCYMIDRAGSEACSNASELPEKADERQNYLKECWHTALRALDSQGRRVLFLIRGMDNLDDADPLWWLPTERYANIRFMLSGAEMPVCSRELNELTKLYYFQSADVFSRENYLDAFMKQHHKQVSDPVRNALLAASENKHPQYMEFLMQRLLLLDQKDFEAIRQEGGGIEAISRHLCRLVAIAPDNLEDIVLEKRALLEEAIGKEWSDKLLGMLLSAPYGLSERILAQTIGQEGKSLPHLSVTMLCRILGNLVHETATGELRIVSSPAASILKEIMLPEIVCASRQLAEAMEKRMGAQKETEPGWSELIGSQYLLTAFQAERTGGLGRCLTFLKDNPDQAVLTIRALQRRPDSVAWLETESGSLSEENLVFCTENLFPSIERLGYLDGPFFEMWKAIVPIADRLKRDEPSHARIRLDFFTNYQCGLLAQKTEEPEAASWLLQAKRLAKEDFARYHNRVWRITHGFELTPEEKRQDEEFLKQSGMEEIGGVNFGYGSEVQDMLTEQTWSDHVRVINSLLESIYRKNGDTEKAQALYAEVEEMTRMLDPVIRSGKGEIGNSATVIYPDSVGPKTYKPDYRRNTAIQIAKEGHRLKEQGKHREALEKYEESSRMLLQIYEDGKTGELYDMSNVPDAETQARRLQTECLRDLALNYEETIACLMKVDPAKVEDHLAKMMKYGLMFDSARNSRESKADLKNYYAVASAAYSLLPGPDMPEKLLETVIKYHQYYEEAFLKGERKGEFETKQRNSVNHNLYICLTKHPEMGGPGTDLLLKISNGSVMAQDFENFCEIAHLMSALIDWTQAHGIFWQGSQISLEKLYVTNMHNICSLWENNHMWNRLKEDGEKLESQFPAIRESESILLAGEILSMLGLRYFSEGEYGRAAQIFKGVMSRIDALPEEACTAIIRIQHRSRLLSALSESGELKAAEMTAVALENEIEAESKRGWTTLYMQWEVTPESFRSTLANELAICLMNHAIVASRMGESERGLQLLDRTEALVQRESGSGAISADIIQRVRYFRKNGLPTPQTSSGDEKRYRELQNKLIEIIRQPPKTRAEAKASADHFDAYLKEMVELHHKGLFGDNMGFAEFFHYLYMLRMHAGEQNAAVNALLRAKELADGDGEPCALYGRIYCDWAAFCSPDEQLEATQKAISVFEALRKRGEQYSKDDLAIAFWNRGLIFYKMNRRNEARTDVNQAVALWKDVLRTGDSETVRMRLSDAQRLLRIIEKND